MNFTESTRRQIHNFHMRTGKFPAEIKMSERAAKLLISEVLPGTDVDFTLGSGLQFYGCTVVVDDFVVGVF